MARQKTIKNIKKGLFPVRKSARVRNQKSKNISSVKELAQKIINEKAELDDKEQNELDFSPEHVTRNSKTILNCPTDIIVMIGKMSGLAAMFNFSLSCQTAFSGLGGLCKVPSLEIRQNFWETRIATAAKETFVITENYYGQLERNAERHLLGGISVLIENSDVYGNAVTTITSEDHYRTTEAFLNHLRNTFGPYEVTRVGN
ncbi:hypothetical protein B9Z55_022443 [Caenorhabditis nigoni]|uniref:Uncharacterized protein n=1 Tax=Caenorhabditis nigoni TaxID=1611254 RepID=A0A2G5SKP6_9PELO|nr:hypothetical protein B9Z55_022443 [Caenorhabditis nigoni]